MQATPKTIDKLFNSQSRYIVPMFQRLYVWRENPQWATLWEDLAEKAALRLDNALRVDKKKSNAHYLGALIIEGVKPTSANEVTRILVIDGQQRLTTIQLLLCAFRDLASQNEWVALEKKANRYIENPDADTMENPEDEIFKLWPTQLNREVFSSIITSGGKEEVETRFPLIRRKYQRKPDPRSNLVEAYLYFYGRLSSWIDEQAKERKIERDACALQLLQAVQQDFCVVEISLSDGDDSQEIFYSLNSQGRQLSQSDLLRSLIFMRAEKESEDRDALFADFWGEFETDFWNVEVKRGGRTYTKLDLALRHFLTVKTGRLIDNRGTLATLNSDRQREKAEFGYLITMDAPTKAMRDEVAAAGKYKHPLLNREDDRLQIITVADILRGDRLDLPMARADAVKAAAAIGDADKQASLL